MEMEIFWDFQNCFLHCDALIELQTSNPRLQNQNNIVLQRQPGICRFLQSTVLEVMEQDNSRPNQNRVMIYVIAYEGFDIRKKHWPQFYGIML